MRPHHLLSRLGRHVPSRLAIDMVRELRTELDHLFHRAVLCERTIFVAIYTIVLIAAPAHIRPHVLIRQRHSATLAKFHLHHCFLH